VTGGAETLVKKESIVVDFKLEAAGALREEEGALEDIEKERKRNQQENYQD
jgi:hypothetical protein